MTKKEKRKYVVEIIMQKEERMFFSENTPQRGALKNWNGNSKLYAKELPRGGYIETPDLNDATSFDNEGNAMAFASYITSWSQDSARVIEILEIKQEIGYVGGIFKSKRDFLQNAHT